MNLKKAVEIAKKQDPTLFAIIDSLESEIAEKNRMLGCARREKLRLVQEVIRKA